MCPYEFNTNVNKSRKESNTSIDLTSTNGNPAADVASISTKEKDHGKDRQCSKKRSFHPVGG